jgi:hypothetical protein
LLNSRSHLSDQCTRLFISFCKLCCSSSLATSRIWQQCMVCDI